MKKSKTIIALSLAFVLSATLVSCKTDTKPNDGKASSNNETSMASAETSGNQNPDETTGKSSQTSDLDKNDSSSKTTASESVTETAEAKTLEEKIFQAGLAEVEKENFEYKFYVILEKADKWLINYVSKDGKSSLSEEMTKSDYKILNSSIKNWEEQDIPSSKDDYNKISDRLFAEIENLEHGTAGSSLKQVSVAADYLNLIAEGEYSSYEFYIFLNDYRTLVVEKSAEAIEMFDTNIRALQETVDLLVKKDETTVRVLQDAGKSLSEAAMTLTEADVAPYLWAPFD